MAKILLVEDDINLSEIYKARLEAEGYTIVSAGDGEAALALAVKERPDLIICDVMMPKISGFEMLDILRGTPGIQNTKVIIMTALSQAEDKDRADSLGADRYLVKSQVTLEDVVETAKATLAENGGPQPSPTKPAVPTSAPVNTAPAQPVSPPISQPPTQDPTATPAVPAPSTNYSASDNSTSAAPIDRSNDVDSAPSTKLVEEINAGLSQSSASEEKGIDQQIDNFIGQTPDAQSSSNQPQAAPANRSGEGIDIPGKKVIQPINDPNAKPDFAALLAKEQAKELEKAGGQPVVTDAVNAATESSGYLNTPAFQPGQSNPNNNSPIDPNNVAL